MAVVVQQAKVSGNAEHGWIVELHDGGTFRAIPLKADDMMSALNAGFKKWEDEFKKVFMAPAVKSVEPAPPKPAPTDMKSPQPMPVPPSPRAPTMTPPVAKEPSTQKD